MTPDEIQAYAENIEWHLYPDDDQTPETRQRAHEQLDALVAEVERLTREVAARGRTVTALSAEVQRLTQISDRRQKWCNQHLRDLSAAEAEVERLTREAQRQETGYVEVIALLTKDASDQKAEVERLRGALDRLDLSYRLWREGKPVRDLAETLAEVQAALASAGGDTADPEPRCTHGDHHFDRTLCACGAMHYYCDDCGACLDDCPVRGETEPRCTCGVTPSQPRRAACPVHGEA